ncbi:MAG: winged helix-turn-helix transcriptional regulator [Hungatella sp.]|nr:winged helix-turn-helix transcriptional regulator [Hungatella sp.]
MNTTSLKRLLDACFTAKHIIETMPALPKGMKPRHIHVLDSVDEVCREQGECRVGDVSGRLNITMPSITKLIQELEVMGLLEKYGDRADKRVYLLRLTDRGEEYVRKYVREFHEEWVKGLGDISDGQAEEGIKLIEKLQSAMPGIGAGDVAGAAKGCAPIRIR